MTERYEAIIVGGGIAGSAMAITLARAGRSVLLLEQTEVYQDKVRGEWLGNWGVNEARRLDLEGLLIGAGAHQVLRHVSFDEHHSPEEAIAAMFPLDTFLPGVAGPLTIGHPHHCQTLFDEAGRRGAETLRGVKVGKICLGSAPSVTFVHDGRERTAYAQLIFGADGRQSVVRDAAGIPLQLDKPHHWFAGLLIEGADGWDNSRQSIGVERDFNFTILPQGNGRVRVYGGYSLDQRGRFSGKDGVARFLETFRMECCPDGTSLADGTPAGPLFSYLNNDSWTDQPFAPGAVLIGDAAGWNDPIIGMGLSIAYRDVRIVSEILKDTADWSRVSFAPYAEERRERMRRLRFVASLVSTLDVEFDEAARTRRKRYLDRVAADPTVASHKLAILAGPETLPTEVFMPEHRERLLGAALISTA